MNTRSAYPDKQEDSIATLRCELADTRRRLAEAERALSAMRNGQNHTVVDASDAAIYQLSKDLKIETWSPQAQRLYGYLYQDIIGRPVSVLGDDGHGSEILNMAKQAAVNSEPVSAPAVSRLREDGRHLQVHVTVAPVGRPDEPVSGYVVIDRVLSQQKKPEQRLRESESRFQATFENSAVGIAHVAPDGKWLRVNEKLCEIVGYPAEVLITKSFQDITHPDDLGADLTLLARLLEGELTHYQMDKRYVRADGSIVWVGLTVSLERLADGTPDYFIAVIRDVSARKKAAADLEAVSRTFRQLVENSPFGVYIVDADFRISQISAGGQKAFENVKPLVGRDFAEAISILWPEDIAKDIIARFRTTLETGEPYRQTRMVENRRDRDATEAYDWKIERITMPDGRHGVVCHFYDLSERQQYQTALQERLDEIEALYEHSPLGLALFDRDLRFLRVNKALAAMNGLSISQHIGQRAWDIVPALRSVAEPKMRRVLETGEMFEGEIAGETPAQPGIVRYWHETYYPIKAPDGTVVSIGATIEDITTEKLAERALRDSEQCFRGIFEHSPTGIAIMDIGGEVLSCNAAFSTLLGYDVSSLQARRMIDLVHPADRASHLARTEEIARQETRRFEIETRLIRKDGATIWVDMHMGGLRDADDQPSLVIALVADKTARKRAEAGLAQSEKQLRLILDSAVAMIGLLDLDGTLREANSAALVSGGLTRADVVGKPFWDCYWWSHDQFEITRLKEAVAQARSGETVRYDATVRMAGDTRMTIDFMLAPVRDDDGKVTMLVPSGYDITDRKRGEERQEVLKRELAHRGKNMIAVIQAIARRTLTAERSTADANAILTGRLQALANSYAPLTESGQGRADLQSLVERELEPFADRTRIQGCDVRLGPETAQTFSLVLHELATNAAKYGALSRPGGTVAITWDIEGYGADRVLNFEWRETGGPQPSAPKHKGFGSVLITQMASADLQCTPELDYAPGGLIYRIEVSMALLDRD